MPPRSRSQAQSGDKDLPPVPTTAQETARGVTEQDPQAQEKAQEVLEAKAEGDSTSQPAGGYNKLPQAGGDPQMRTSDGTTAAQGVQAPTSHLQVTESKGADPDNEKAGTDKKPTASSASSVAPAQYDISDEDILPPQSR